jgi:NADPH:quinone reductase-like Zn-dependent oxidoreductase
MLGHGDPGCLNYSEARHATLNVRIRLGDGDAGVTHKGSILIFHRKMPGLNEHKIRRVIDQVYPFETAREAYEHLARGAFGKVVIKVA